jgi:hypothetical protein
MGGNGPQPAIQSTLNSAFDNGHSPWARRSAEAVEQATTRENAQNLPSDSIHRP